MPGYDSDVIMAAGAFVQGSSIELSADGPETTICGLFQGRTPHGTMQFSGILMSFTKLYERNLVA